MGEYTNIIDIILVRLYTVFAPAGCGVLLVWILSMPHLLHTCTHPSPSTSRYNQMCPDMARYVQICLGNVQIHSVTA